MSPKELSKILEGITKAVGNVENDPEREYIAAAAKNAVRLVAIKNGWSAETVDGEFDYEENEYADGNDDEPPKNEQERFDDLFEEDSDNEESKTETVRNETDTASLAIIAFSVSVPVILALYVILFL